MLIAAFAWDWKYPQFSHDLAGGENGVGFAKGER